MNLLVVGLGSIGRRHLANVKAVDPSARVTVWHQHSRSRPSDESQADRVVFDLVEALAESPDAAVVAGPASSHVATALALAERGVHLLVEKPLSNTLDGVDALLETCRRGHLVLMVGYNFRHYTPLQLIREALVAGRIGRVLSIRAEVGQYLPDWRPDSDYRRGVSARAGLGGGVLLELSHELDYVRWLVGEVETVSAMSAQLGDLDIDVEDVAEIVLRFRNGAVGSVHLDMLQRAATRTCRVFGTGGTLTWDASTHQVRLFDAAAQQWSDLCPATALDRNGMYLAELRHFLRCIAGRQLEPVASGDDGRRILELVLAAKRSAATGEVVSV